jgi:erythromycin esterase
MTDDTSGTTDARHDDTTYDDVLDGLRGATTPLATTDPTADDADLGPVGEALADARVVGLGEATHGTREFFQLKHRLLRHLVTEHGVRAFAMEANLPEAEALDDYVVHGEGDPAEALAGVYFWTWQTESVLAMVEWLREFNEGRPLDDRVRFHGFDAQYTHGAVERLREHLAAGGVDLPGDVDADLDTLDDEGDPPHDAEDVPERVEAADRAVPRLADLLAGHRADLVAATSERAHERARRYVEVLEQAVDFAAAMDGMESDIVDAEDDDEDAMERVMETRDGAMADNVEWLLGRADAEPLVLWAHDAHLNRSAQTDRDTGASAPSLGSRLADAHADDYRAVGFSFARGAFQAVGEDDDGEYGLHEYGLDEPVEGTVVETLAALGEPLSFVDLRAAAGDDRLGDWLAEPRPHFSLGAVFDDDPEEYLTEYAYGEAFDAVCFVEETTRARPLEDDDEDED